MRLALSVTILALLACSSPATQSPRTPQPAQPTNTPRPTAAPAPTRTPTPVVVNYRRLKTDLLIALGPLIVAVRDRSPNASAWLARFNEVADTVLPQIQGDMAKEANLLHSAIVQVRTTPNDLRALEGARGWLMEIP